MERELDARVRGVSSAVSERFAGNAAVVTEFRTVFIS